MESTSPRRNATSRKADVAWPTVGHRRVEDTAERPHLPQYKGSDHEFDANHSWNPRERVITRGIGDYLGRSEDIAVEVGEWEPHLLAPSDVAGVITWR